MKFDSRIHIHSALSQAARGIFRYRVDTKLRLANC